MRIWVDLKKVGCYVYSLLFAASFFTPQIVKNIKLLNTVLDIITILEILSILLICFVYKKRKIEKIDIVFCLFAVCIFFSGVKNFENIFDTAKVLMKISFIYLFLENILLFQYKERIAILEALANYFNVICILNTVYAFAVGGLKFNRIFLIGSDNGAASFYFLAVFLSFYVSKIKEDKSRFSIFIQCINVFIYAVYLQIGSAILWILGGMLVAFWETKNRTSNEEMHLNYYLLYSVPLCAWLLFLFTKIELWKEIINKLFYEKFVSISSRVQLWMFFLEKVKQSPLLGYGASNSRYLNMPESLIKWKLYGNCHNIYVDIIYHYGGLSFVLFMILVVFVAANQNRSGKMGIFLFLFFLHGLVEAGAGMVYAFVYIVLLYYECEMYIGKGISLDE